MHIWRPGAACCLHSIHSTHKRRHKRIKTPFLHHRRWRWRWRRHLQVGQREFLLLCDKRANFIFICFVLLSTGQPVPSTHITSHITASSTPLHSPSAHSILRLPPLTPSTSPPCFLCRLTGCLLLPPPLRHPSLSEILVSPTLLNSTPPPDQRRLPPTLNDIRGEANNVITLAEKLRYCY